MYVWHQWKASGKQSVITTPNIREDRNMRNRRKITFNPAQPTIPVTTVTVSGWRATYELNIYVT
jgi:hypothetical protein